MKLITYSNCIDITDIVKECPATIDDYCLIMVVSSDSKEDIYKYMDLAKKTIEITKEQF